MPLSIFLDFLFLFVIVAISISIGIFIGDKIRNRNSATKKSLSSVIGATLTFLGFLLALTLSMTSSRFASRKQLVLDEANAIGTAILRTDVLDEPVRRESLELLTEYVEVRARVADQIDGDDGVISDNFSAILEESEELHERLWSLAFQSSNRYQEPELFGFYLESLNEVIDIHSERFYQGLQYQLSRGVWFLLYFVTILTMLAVGYEFGINGSGSILGVVVLSLILATVLSVIGALDNGGRGSLFKVSQQPILDLREQLRR